MKGLSLRDMSILKKAFLQALNEEVKGNEEKCIERTRIFKATRMKAYSEEVIPFVVQDLITDKFIERCSNNEVKITNKGMQSLNRSVEGNAYFILQTLVTRLSTVEPRPSSGIQVKELTDLSTTEINDAVDFLEETGYVEIMRENAIDPFNFYSIVLTSKGMEEYGHIATHESRGKVNKRWQNCFLSVPYGTDVSIIKLILNKKGINTIILSETISPSPPLPEQVTRLIAKSDFVIAVINSSDITNVYFELGTAYTLKKQILLLVSPKVNLDSLFSNFPYIRSDEKNTMAISFALDHILGIPKHTKHNTKEFVDKSRPIGNIADSLIAKLDKLADQIGEKDLEDIIVSALQASGIRLLSTAFQQKYGAGRPDIAIWSDELQTELGNPLFVEVKKNISYQDIRSITENITRGISRVNSKWALVLYNQGPSSESLYKAPSPGSFTSKSYTSASFTVPGPGILFLQIRDLLGKLREKSFARIILDSRNSKIYGKGS